MTTDTDPWRTAVEEQLIAHGLDIPGPQEDPATALKRLIEFSNLQVADPDIHESLLPPALLEVAEKAKNFKDFEHLIGFVEEMSMRLSHGASVYGDGAWRVSEPASLVRALNAALLDGRLVDAVNYLSFLHALGARVLGSNLHLMEGGRPGFATARASRATSDFERSIQDQMLAAPSLSNSARNAVLNSTFTSTMRMPTNPGSGSSVMWMDESPESESPRYADLVNRINTTRREVADLTGISVPVPASAGSFIYPPYLPQPQGQEAILGLDTLIRTGREGCSRNNDWFNEHYCVVVSPTIALELGISQFAQRTDDPTRFYGVRVFTRPMPLGMEREAFLFEGNSVVPGTCSGTGAVLGQHIPETTNPAQPTNGPEPQAPQEVPAQAAVPEPAGVLFGVDHALDAARFIPQHAFDPEPLSGGGADNGQGNVAGHEPAGGDEQRDGGPVAPGVRQGPRGQAEGRLYRASYRRR